MALSTPTWLKALPLCWSLLCSSAFAFSDLVPEVSPISEYKAKYSLKWHGWHAGYSTHALTKQEDDSYLLVAESEPRFDFLPFEYYEHTRFNWFKDMIYPVEYVYDNQEGTKYKQGKLSFDWLKERVLNNVAGRPWHLGILPGTQDKISHTLLLRYDLKQGKKELSYPVADGGYVKDYNFTILGEEKIMTTLGELNTLKLEHQSKRKRRTTMWLAKDFDFLLVKVQQFRKGKKVGEGNIKWYTPISQEG